MGLAYGCITHSRRCKNQTEVTWHNVMDHCVTVEVYQRWSVGGGLSAVMHQWRSISDDHEKWSVRDGIIDSIVHTCMETREESLVYTDPLLCTIITKHTPSPLHLSRDPTQLTIHYKLTNPSLNTKHKQQHAEQNIFEPEAFRFPYLLAPTSSIKTEPTKPLLSPHSLRTSRARRILRRAINTLNRVNPRHRDLSLVGVRRRLARYRAAARRSKV